MVMKCEKNMRKDKDTLALFCIAAALLLWGMLVVAPAFPGKPTGDTMAQLAQVHSHCIDNWKPALYAYLLMLGENIAAGGGVKLAYLLQCCLFGLGLGLIVLSLCRESIKFLILLLLLPFFGNKGCMITTVGNDAMAASCYLSFVGCIMFFRTTSDKFWRVVALIAGIVLLWYGMVMRHNSIFCVTALLAWFFWSISYPFKKAVCLSAICALCFLVLNFSIMHVCQVEKSYPLKSAFSDDLVNISILNGEWDTFCIEKQKESDISLAAPHEAAELAADVCNFYPSGLSPYEKIKDPNEREIDYERYKVAWIRCVTGNLPQYFTLKAYFFHQFLMAGRSVPFVNAYIQKEFPHVKIKGGNWYRHWRQWIGVLFIFNALIPMISYAAFLFMLYKVVVKKDEYNKLVYDSLFILAANCLYTAPFSIFTLSVTEERYYIITSSLSLIGVSLLVMGMIKTRVDNHRKELL